MGHAIALDTPTGRIGAWRADPAGAPRGALVVVQEIFGVNAHIRGVVDRFAALGFIALAPALFDHLEPGVELGYDDAGVARGRTLVAELGFERALGDLQAAIERLQAQARVGVVGYCWGGTLAYLANTRLGRAAVSYYGGRTVPFLHETLRAPMLFHFGERDRIIPPADVAAHRAAHPDAIVHVYAAGHGFNCEARADHDPDCAALALQRTVDFFGEQLA